MNQSGTKTNQKNINSKSIVWQKRTLLPKYKDVITSFIDEYDGYRNWRYRNMPVPPYSGYMKNTVINPESRDQAELPPGLVGSGAFK